MYLKKSEKSDEKADQQKLSIVIPTRKLVSAISRTGEANITYLFY